MNAPNSDRIHFHGLHIPVEDLFSSACVLGRPGSGKSRACTRILLRELTKLRADDQSMKAGLLCLDGKGSELRGFVEEALRQCGREQDLVIIGPQDATFNPFKDSTWTDAKVANEIIAAANFLGGESAAQRKSTDPFWSNATLDLLTSLVGVARHHLAVQDGSQRRLGIEPLNLDHILRLRPMLTKPDKEMQRIAAGLAFEMNNAAGTSLLEFAALPTGTRQSVASSVGPMLAPFGREPLCNVLIPAKNRPEADLQDIIEQGKVVLLDIGEAEHAFELLPAAALLKSAFAKLVLSRKRKSVNQTRPVFAIFEEFQKVFTAQADSAACEANYMDASRWCRCGTILITQGISGLLAKQASPALIDKLFNLIGTVICLGSNDPATAHYAGRAFGTRTRQVVHRTVSPTLPPPLIFPDDEGTVSQTESQMLVPVTEPVLSAATLSALPVGKMHIALRDGSTHVIQADVAAP